MLNKCGENIPQHYLDELPPVTFNNMDVSNLISKMERLHSEVCALRHAVKLQADIADITTTTDNRVAVMERKLEPSYGTRHCLDLPSDAGPLGASAVGGGVELVATVGVPGSSVNSDLISCPCFCTLRGDGPGQGCR